MECSISINIVYNNVVAIGKENIMKNITEIIELEQGIAKMLADLIAQIKHDTISSPMDGVCTVTHNAATVNVSSLNAGILCPYYYLQNAQAEIVERYLKPVKTASEFVDKIHNMINAKKVNYKGEVYHLNPKTIAVLTNCLAQHKD